MKGVEAPISGIDVSAYTIPTDGPEGDGTFRWESTTLVLCEIEAGAERGLGYTYGSKATAVVANQLGGKCLAQRSALDIPGLHEAMVAEVRNNGSRGIASMAISALDIALWDLKAKLLDCSVVDLMGARRPDAPIYGSGGFTTYDNARLAKQLSGWAAEGIRSVKMKVGAEPERDLDRVRAARDAIGTGTALFVDANGGYPLSQAERFGQRFAEFGVSWFEEPVSSDDLAGLRRIRDGTPPGMEIAAGEYGYDSFYFRRMLEAEAVDVLQIDATRAKGFTGFLQAAAVAAAFGRPVSAHCAPALHMHVGCVAEGFRNFEYFHDHVRIEQMLFDGFPSPAGGCLQPDRSRPGLGLAFKHRDAERYRERSFL